LSEEDAEEFSSLEGAVQQASLLKCREIVTESVSEYNRRGNFVRIYPAKGSNMYDQYFQGARPLNKMLYKVLYQEKLLSISPQKPLTVKGSDHNGYNTGGLSSPLNKKEELSD
jgi:hypothetical protein